MLDPTRPRRRAALAFFAMALALGALVAFVTLRDFDANPSRLVNAGVPTLLMLGFFAALAMAMGNVFDARLLARLARNEGVLCRYTIAHDEWRALWAARRADAQRARCPGAVAPPEGSGSGTSAIVVSLDAVFVGDAMTPLETQAGPFVRLHGPWLEFDWESDELPCHVFAIPVPADQMRVAEGVVEAFKQDWLARHRAPG